MLGESTDNYVQGRAMIMLFERVESTDNYVWERAQTSALGKTGRMDLANFKQITSALMTLVLALGVSASFLPMNLL